MSAAALPALGTLTDRVQLQRKTAVSEPEGGQAVVWTPLGTVWSRVRPVSARLTSYADGRTALVSHTVVMRFRTDLGPGDRVVYRGRALEIVSAEDLNGRRAFLGCACTEPALAG